MEGTIDSSIAPVRSKGRASNGFRDPRSPQGLIWIWKPASILAMSLVATLLIGLMTSTNRADAATLVPGSGEKISNVGDDFEAEDWDYTFNLPKSSYDLDHNIRIPGGSSKNGRWAESAKRGQPDLIKRVETPPGGLEGSMGSLLLATRNSGIPGNISWQMQQDDFLVNTRQQIGGYLSVSRNPSCVVRVFLPPFEKWENRTGSSFALRADCRGTKGNGGALESYWPGMFIHFDSETDPRFQTDAARFLLRAGPRGYDFRGPEIKELGWWTLGMSFTADGQIHYYASPGIDDLTEEDYITSQHPYGFRCQQFHTFFFNVANMDNGKTWSTPWIIDDVALYIIRPESQQTASRNQRPQR
ncbi:MAG: hypothetical protein JW829_16460 [Pirellulales bacterium]|nr:hypothetical protein [Pirellulales bacterium]